MHGWIPVSDDILDGRGIRRGAIGLWRSASDAHRNAGTHACSHSDFDADSCCYASSDANADPHPNADGHAYGYTVARAYPNTVADA